MSFVKGLKDTIRVGPGKDSHSDPAGSLFPRAACLIMIVGNGS